MKIDNNIDLDGNKIINSSAPTGPGDLVNLQHIQDDTRFNTANVLIVKINPGHNEFSSIAAALATIVGSSNTNRFLIKVNPGNYVEPLIDMVAYPYVSIAGDAIQMPVISPSGNHHIFSLGIYNEISFLWLDGALTGFAGIACLDSGIYSQAHKVTFNNCDIGILITTATQETDFYGEYIDFNGTYSYGVKVIASSGFRAFANLENYYNFPGFPGIIAGTYASGVGADIDVLSAGNIGVGDGYAIYADDGAFISILSTYVKDFGTALHVANIGSAPVISIAGLKSLNTTTYDLNILHPGTNGTIAGVAAHSKILNVSTNIGWTFLDPDTKEFNITNKLSISFPNAAYDTHTDISTLIMEGSTMGIIKGGILSNAGGFTINVDAGYGYFEQLPDLGVIQKHTWSNTSIIIPINSDVYLYWSNAQFPVLSISSSQPSTLYNIFLGRVVTDGSGIILIDAIPSNAEHASNRFGNLFREALGPIYASGSIVTENVTPFHIDVNGGRYYFSSNVINTSGGNDITFIPTLGGVAQPAIQIVAQSYDNSGVLTPIPSLQYAKHSLYVVGSGANENYFLVYATTYYASLLNVQQANIPLPPTWIRDGVSLIAGIIVQQGASSITQFVDQRPIPGYRASGVNASADHTSLLNLTTGDAGHTQFLMLNGSKTMTGTLDLGTHNIINVGTINSITPSDWIKKNGNAYGSNTVIGLTDAFSFGIITNNINRISIASNGEVTISNLAGSGNKLIGVDNTGKLITQYVTTGTLNRISVITGIVDIDANYIGQSSITTLGTITTGVWNSTIVSSIYGGTGSNNIGTLTYGSNNITFTTTGITTLTLPTSGILLNNTLNAGQIYIGNGSNVATGVTASGELTNTSSGVFTLSNSAVINKVLTGYVSGTGTVSASDSILQAIQKLNGNISLVSGANVYQGLWNSLTNTPTLTSGIGTKGYMYKVSVASSGVTTLDGLSQWNVGDQLYFDGTTWDKIDGIASEVVSVNGLVGTVALTGTTNRITISVANVFDIAATYVGQSSITTLGTITTGIWNGTIIDIAHGGTNSSVTLNNNRIMISSGGSIVEHATQTTGNVSFYDANGLPTGDSTLQWNNTTKNLSVGSTPTSDRFSVTSDALQRAVLINSQYQGLAVTTSHDTAYSLYLGNTSINVGSIDILSLSNTGHVATTNSSSFTKYENVATSGIVTVGKFGVVITDITSGTYKSAFIWQTPNETNGTLVERMRLSSAGILSGSTWNGSIISPTYGGTGVNNGTNTLTLAGNLVTIGSNTLTFTTTGVTNLTLPTTGLLVSTANNLSVFSATTSAQLASVITDETGTGSLVFATSPTITGGAHTALISLGIRSTGTGAFDLSILNSENLTAPRSLTITLNDTIRTLNLNGNITVGANFTTVGANSLILTTSGVTNVTLPTSGTLITTTVSTLSSLTSIGTITTGVWNASIISPTYGGTGISTYTIGDLIFASGVSTLSKLSDVATGNVLISGGIGISPSYGKVVLTTHVSGILPSTNGGTGISNTNTITLGGDINMASSFTTSGANALILTTTAATNITLPTTGTLIARDRFFRNIVSTTDTTTTIISTISTISNKSYYLEVRAQFRKTGGAGVGITGDSGAFTRTFKVKNVSGVLTLGIIQSDYTSRDITNDITITTSGTNILINVVGTVSNNIDWVAVTETIEL